MFAYQLGHALAVLPAKILDDRFVTMTNKSASSFLKLGLDRTTVLVSHLQTKDASAWNKPQMQKIDPTHAITTVSMGPLYDHGPDRCQAMGVCAAPDPRL